MRAFRFLAMKRSGHHAIMNWICRNSECKFLNNVNSSSEKQYLQSLNMCEFLKNSDIFIYNIEDYDPEKEPYHILAEYKDFEVVVLRDLYNCMASRFMSNDVPKQGMLELWKKHAKMFMLDDDRIKINFNHWFKSINYRNKIANQIGIINQDHGVNQVSNFGNGSSFDYLSYDGKAQEMKVLNRYQSLKDNLEFLRYIDDESIHLNDIIFSCKYL